MFNKVSFFFVPVCMSQKAPLPSLTGHRLKTRKRDEKKAYDPQGFRDAILEGLEAAGKSLIKEKESDSVISTFFVIRMVKVPPSINFYTTSV